MAQPTTARPAPIVLYRTMYALQSPAEALRLLALALDQGWHLKRRASQSQIDLTCGGGECRITATLLTHDTVIAAEGECAIRFVENARRARDLALQGEGVSDD